MLLLHNLFKFTTLLIAFHYVISSPIDKIDGEERYPKIHTIDELDEMVISFYEFYDEETADKLENNFYETFFTLGGDGQVFAGLDFKDIFERITSGKADDKTCKTCKMLLSVAKSLIKNEEKAAIDLVKKLCKNAKFTTDRICDGIVSRLGPPIFHVLKHSQLTQNELCSTLIAPECQTFFNDTMTPMIKYELKLPERKPFKPIIGNEKRYKMLHITDIHLDLEYEEGKNTLCGEYLCCRKDSPGHNTSAGFWSDTRGACDAPMNFIEHALNHIAVTHNHELDFVIFTGDIVPHNIWSTTQDGNINYVNVIYDLLGKTFPNMKVYPALGNHEAHPINQFPLPEMAPNVSISWLYDLAATKWSKWLPKEALETVKKAGHYAVNVSPKLKLISLNSNYCYRTNFYIFINPVDAGGQLQFLINELDKAERDGQYVMIISHIPVGSDCIDSWTHNYARILERYQHLLVAQYQGHTHKDEFVVIYSNHSNSQSSLGQRTIKPVGVQLIGPSLTTYDYLNPGYRVFTLDGNGKPLDYRSFYTNIPEDNSRGQKIRPTWEFAYSPAEAYQLSSISPEQMANLVDRMQNPSNHVLRNKYFNFYHRFSKEFEDHEGNNENTKMNLIKSCKVVDKLG